MCENIFWLHPLNKISALSIHAKKCLPSSHQNKMSALYAWYYHGLRVDLIFFILLTMFSLQRPGYFDTYFGYYLSCPYTWCPGLDGEMSVAKFGLYWILLKLLGHAIFQLNYFNLHHIRSASVRICNCATCCWINMSHWAKIHIFWDKYLFHNIVSTLSQC